MVFAQRRLPGELAEDLHHLVVDPVWMRRADGLRSAGLQVGAQDRLGPDRLVRVPRTRGATERRARVSRGESSRLPPRVGPA